MPLEIQNGRREVFKSVEPLIEPAGLDDFGEQFRRDRLTGFMVAGIVAENVRLDGPVFFER